MRVELEQLIELIGRTGKCDLFKLDFHSYESVDRESISHDVMRKSKEIRAIFCSFFA